MSQTNIILTGVGGQGVVTAGMLIGNAVTQSGLNAVMSEIHGMSQRGGVVTVELRIGDVFGPIIPDGIANLVLGFEAMETLRVLKRAGKDTIVIMNTERIVPFTVNIGDAKYPDIDPLISRLKEKGTKLYPIDARSLGEEAGNVMSSNVVITGAAFSTGLIPVNISALEDSVRRMFSPKSWDTNLKALKLGMEAYVSLESDGKRRIASVALR